MWPDTTSECAKQQFRLFTINRNGVHDHWNTQAGAANAVRAGASEAVAVVLVEGGVQVTVRRIVAHLPLGAPGQAEWRQMAADFNLAPT